MPQKSGDVTRNTYDSYGRLEQRVIETKGTSQTWRYVYEADNLTGLYDAVVSPEDVRTDYTYDAMNRVTAMIVHGETGTQTTTYSYDSAGNLISEADAVGELRYADDAAGRIASMTQKDGTVMAYTYDGNGNTTEIFENGELIEQNSYDARNRLVSMKAR